MEVCFMSPEWQFYLAIVIFLITYGIIISEKIHRSVIALFGAGLMVIFGITDIHQVFEHYIEWSTIALLVGMMILVGITAKTGVFQYVAIKAAKWVKGDPLRLLITLSALTAFASAFLDNVTTVLLIVPVTFSITRILGINPVPYLIAEIIASNIGGTATLIGDPPNIMIGSENPHLTFNAFLFNLGPIAFIIMCVTLVMLYFIYRKQLKYDAEKSKMLMALNEKEYITDVPLMKKSLFVLGLTILGFVLHSVIHVDSSVIAMLGATVLMLVGLREHDVEEAFDSVEWATIFFFVGLFALVGGLQASGVIESMATQFLQWTNYEVEATAVVILWVSGIASGFIDNIPFVATMIPLIDSMASDLNLAIDSPQINTLWWSLALGACLGGNMTIIGASANVIVAGLASREGHGFSYWEFLKIGFPITIVSLVLAHVYIYLRYLLFL
jgi:Na+/H+ antiporter NhaD/arsenite permease-like protein